MRILALDTATENCSVALWIDGEVHHRAHVSAREHSERLLPMVDAVLAEAGLVLAQLDLLALDRGPGGFTGVRIATGVVQGLAMGAGLAVMPVSSLAAVAAAARRRHGVERVLALLDARMGEVYAGGWDFGGGHDWPRAVLAEQVCPPARVALPAEGHWFGAGPGWSVHAAALGAVRDALVGCEPALLPDAREVAALAAAAVAAGVGPLDPAQVWPIYLRDRVAEPKARPPAAR